MAKENETIKSKQLGLEEQEFLTNEEDNEELEGNIQKSEFTERSVVKDSIDANDTAQIGSEIPTLKQSKTNQNTSVLNQDNSDENELEDLESSLSNYNTNIAIDNDQNELSTRNDEQDINDSAVEPNAINLDQEELDLKDNSTQEQPPASTGEDNNDQLNSAPINSPLASSESQPTEEANEQETTEEEIDLPDNTTTVDSKADGLEVDLEIDDFSAKEDSGEIPINFKITLQDQDGSEEVTIQISGIPDGASLNNGFLLENGDWQVPVNSIDGLQLNLPENFSGDFNLSIAVTNTETLSGDSNTVTKTMSLSIEAVADEPTLTVQNISMAEDQSIPLNIESALTDTDGSETLTITISGVPEGATLSAGTLNTDGTWTLNNDDLEGLTLTPPNNSDEDFNLSITATSTEENGDSASVTKQIDVEVTAVADAPQISIQSAQGQEDKWIQLDIQGDLQDTDGSESLSFTISNVPEGSRFSPAGTDNGDGTWTFTEEQAEVLCILPPENSSDDFTLSIKAIVTENENGDQYTQDYELPITLEAVADSPNLSASDVTGQEDNAINLDITSSLNDNDSSETLSIIIEDVPDGVILNNGTNNGDGTWSLTPQDLEGLTITPVSNSDEDFSITIKAISTEENGDQSTSTSEISVDVQAVADEPIVTVSPASGTEDRWLQLDIKGELQDQDGSETLTFLVTDVPDGSRFSPAGTDNGDGTWTFTEEQAEVLCILPPKNSSGDFSLSIQAIVTESENGDQYSESFDLPITIGAVADAPTLETSNVNTTEDSTIELNINSSLTDTDGSEVLSIIIEGIPDGASLNSGTKNSDGTWTLQQDDLEGLELTPPTNSSEDMNLSVTAISTEENGDTSTTTSNISIEISAVADEPIVNISPAIGTEDKWLQLEIDGQLQDTDGSETLTFVVSNVPDGARFSPAGTDNGDGTWTFTEDQAEVLCILPPKDSDQNFELKIDAIATEENGDQNIVESTLPVSINAVADQANLNVENAQGNEDNSIALNINSSLSDTDGSESLTITIENVPNDATLNNGTKLSDGTWELTPQDLEGLTITPAVNSSDDITLNIKATTTEQSGAQNTITKSMNIDIEAVADQPKLTTSNIETTVTKNIPVDIDTTLTDIDGSEELEIEISGVPDNVEFNSGINNQDGTWTFDIDDIQNLEMSYLNGETQDFVMHIQAISTESENQDQAISESTISVDYESPIEGVEIEALDVSGKEDKWIKLKFDIDNLDSNNDESTDYFIEGIPNGARLNIGQKVGDGVWKVSEGQLDGNKLKLRPPKNSDEDIELTLKAITTSDSGETLDQSVDFTVDVIGTPDAFKIKTKNTRSFEDDPVDLSTKVDLKDKDGSESIDSVLIKNVPDDGQLNNGEYLGNGTWKLNDEDLDGLQFIPPEDTSGQFKFKVFVTTIEEDSGLSRTMSKNIKSYVKSVSDGIEFDLEDKTFESDEGTYDLDLGIALKDDDGSEKIDWIKIEGLPDDIQLSSGKQDRQGKWTLKEDDLEGLKIITDDDSEGSYNIEITVQSRDKGAKKLVESETFNISFEDSAQIEQGPRNLFEDYIDRFSQAIQSSLDNSNVNQEADFNDFFFISQNEDEDNALFSLENDDGDNESLNELVLLEGNDENEDKIEDQEEVQSIEQDSNEEYSIDNVDLDDMVDDSTTNIA